MRIICRIRGHKRSAERAQYDSENGWRSVCKHCDAPMARLGKGDWCLVSEVADQARPET